MWKTPATTWASVRRGSPSPKRSQRDTGTSKPSPLPGSPNYLVLSQQVWQSYIILPLFLFCFQLFTCALCLHVKYNRISRRETLLNKTKENNLVLRIVKNIQQHYLLINQPCLSSDSDLSDQFISPCGGCRQFMREVSSLNCKWMQVEISILTMFTYSNPRCELFSVQVTVLIFSYLS